MASQLPLTPPPSPTSSSAESDYDGDAETASTSTQLSVRSSQDLGSDGRSVYDSEADYGWVESPRSISSILHSDLDPIPEMQDEEGGEEASIGDDETEDSSSCDELDGPLWRLFTNSVKAFATLALRSAIHEYNAHLCNGCRTSHPSQLQHTCLFGVPAYFMGRYFEALKKRVLTTTFFHAAYDLLEKYNIDASEERVRQAGEAVLHDLKDSEDVLDGLDDIQDELVGDSIAEKRDLYDALSMWEMRQYDGPEDEWD